MKKTLVLIASLAMLAATVSAQVGSLPYTQGFEAGMDQWTTVDLDGDGHNWSVNSVTDYGYVHSGSKSAISYSVDVATFEGYEPDNWLVSPLLTVSDESVVVEFWYRARYTADYEHLSVCVAYGTDSADLVDAAVLSEFTIEGDNVWRQRVLSLAEWAGQDVYVAIRHHDCTLQGALFIDDITFRAANVPVVNLLGLTTVGVGAEVVYTAQLTEGMIGDLQYQWTSVQATAGNATMSGSDEAEMHITYSTIGTDTLTVIVGNEHGADTAQLVVQAADAVVEFPYYTGFEEGDDEGWLTYGGTNSWYVGEAVSYDGDRSLYISNNGGTNNQYTFGSFSTGQASYAARLLTVTQAGDYRVGFNWRCMGEGTDYLRAFIAPASVEFAANVTNGITTTGAPEGWVSIDGGSRRYQQTSWQRQEAAVTLAEGSYWLVFVWRTDYSDGNNPPAAVDSVTMWLYDCSAPTNLVREAVSESSITIGWTPAGIGTQWIVSVDGGAWQLATAPTFEATGLAAGTSHTFTVRSLCSASDTSIAISATFTTQCATVSTYPWYERFDDLDVLRCWDVVSLDGDANTWARYAGTLRVGPVADSSDDWAITRPFAIPADATGLALHWDVATGNYLYGEASYELLVNTEGSYYIGDFGEPLHSETYNGPWARRTVSLADYAGQTVSLAFRKVGTGTGELLIDNMSITIDTPHVQILGDAIVDIEQPATFRALALEGSTATLAYTWSHGLDADVEQEGDSIVITWHEAGTDTLRLVAVNAYGSDTTWMEITVRNLEPANVPYYTSFEVGDDCNWQRIKDGYNMWVIDTAAHSVGARALYISADTGRTNSYADSLSTYAAAYRIVNITEPGSYAVSYDWRANGENGGYQQNDYLRVFMMPAEQELVIGYYGQITATSLPSGCIALDGGSQLNEHPEWQTRNEVVDIVEGGQYRFVFYWRNDGSVGNDPAAAVDNLSISLLSCWAPEGFAVSDVEPDGATISWQSRGDASEWQVQVGGSEPVFVYDTFYIATGLDAATDYEVSIRSVCGDEDTSFALSGSFRTACSLVDVPYTETFNSGEARCWTLLDYNSTSGLTGVAQPPLLGGTYALRLYPGTATQPVFAVLPEMELSEARQVSFMAMGAHVVSLNIGVMSDPQDTTTFVSLGVIDSMESNSSWRDYAVSLDSNTLAQGHVAIRAGVTAESNYPVFLENVMVDTAAYVPPVIDTTIVDTTTPGPIIDTTDVPPIDTTGIVMAREINVSLHPNPATAEVRVSTIGPADISIVDVHGRTLGRWHTEDGEATLPVATLPRGTYFVKVTTTGGTAVGKLLLL